MDHYAFSSVPQTQVFLLNPTAQTLNIVLVKSHSQPLHISYKTTCSFQTHPVLSGLALSLSLNYVPPWDDGSCIISIFLAPNRASVTFCVNQTLEKSTSHPRRTQGWTTSFPKEPHYTWAASGLEWKLQVILCGSWSHDGWEERRKSIYTVRSAAPVNTESLPCNHFGIRGD